MENNKSCKTPRWQLLKSQLNNLSAEAFASAIEASKNALIIDVRTSKEYELGHIAKAINIDYLAESFLDEIEKLDKTCDFFVYCRSGRRSIRVCTLMRNGGFDENKLFNLDTGFGDWLKLYPKAAVLPE